MNFLNFIQSEQKNIRKKLILILLGVILILLSQFFINHIPFQIPSHLKLGVAFLAVIAYAILAKAGTNKHIVRNATVLILVFGIAACVIKPIQFGLDEETHLGRTISLADGNFFLKQHAEIPDTTIIKKYDTLRNGDAPKVGTSFPEEFFKEEHKASTYSGTIVGMANISYIPNAIAWNIGKLISNKLYVSYYLGRIFNVIAFALMVLLALKISKKYREALYLFATFPTTIWMIAGYSYDWMYYGLSLILLAQFTNFISEKKAVGKKQILLFVLTSFLIVFTKFPFVLMGALVLFLPKEKYEKAKDRLFACLIFGVTLLASLGYYFLGNIFKFLFPISASEAANTTIIPGGPVISEHLLAHPDVIIRTLITGAFGSLGNFMGINANDTSSQGPLFTPVYPSMLLALICTLLSAFWLILISARLKITLSKTMKIVLGALFVVITGMIIYSMAKDLRVGFRDGDLAIGGVQSRYFYLFFPTLPLLLSKPIKNWFGLTEKTPDENLDFLQTPMFLLNVLVMGLAIYTLVSVQ